MRILLTNDDGWESPGLAALAGVLRGLGELVVVAPREEMSATGCAITLHGAVEAERVEFDRAAAAWAVKGTPSDCAKLAIRNLLADEAPRLCVSGLNRGPNIGVNVFYSGTVGAAIEAAVNGVPAVAVSKEFRVAPGSTREDTRRGGDELSAADAAGLVGPLLGEALARGLPPWHILNVNLPDRKPDRIRGVRLTRQGVSGFVERYREEAPGPNADLRRFRLEGDMRLREGDGATDAEALAEGFVSVTPMALDLTSRTAADLALRPPEGAAAVDWSWIEATPLGRPRA